MYIVYISLLSLRVWNLARGMQTQCCSPLTGKSLHSPEGILKKRNVECYVISTSLKDDFKHPCQIVPALLLFM